MGKKIVLCGRQFPFFEENWEKNIQLWRAVAIRFHGIVIIIYEALPASQSAPPDRLFWTISTASALVINSQTPSEADKKNGNNFENCYENGEWDRFFFSKNGIQNEIKIKRWRETLSVIDTGN